MLDQPHGADILDAVSRLLRDTLMPRLPPDTVFQARVAANALDLVAREIRFGETVEREALHRLQALLHRDGSLQELESELSLRIRNGELDMQSPGLAEHLWQTTLAKDEDRPAQLCQLPARASKHAQANNNKPKQRNRQRWISTYPTSWSNIWPKSTLSSMPRSSRCRRRTTTSVSSTIAASGRRTDFDKGGLPRPEWEALLEKAKALADKAGFFRFSLPTEFGGQGGGNLWMAVIREHLATQGLGLHNDLQNEHSVVGNFPFIVMLRDFGTQEQKEKFIRGSLARKIRVTFGLTEPQHGSDATHMETRAVRETRDGVAGWRIDGEKMWTTGMHAASHCCLFARTSGKDGDAKGITAFLVPADTAGVKVEEYMWTFNMPTDHPRVSFTNVWVPGKRDVRRDRSRPGAGAGLRA